MFKQGIQFAKELDAKDELKDFREEFHFPKREDGSDFLYFCGNSLGLQPKNVKKYIDIELEDWANLGVEGHFKARNPWMPYHKPLIAPMAKIVGALEKEITIMNSLTVNLHLLMVSFYRPKGRKNKIMIEGGAFPSDQYAVKSQLKFHGINPKEGLIELMPESGAYTLNTKDILENIEKHKEDLALIVLGGVNYFTGQAFEMDLIAECAHKNNIIIGLDLAHAAGNLELELNKWKVDFATWCSYKYLNSGPGGVSGIYVNEKHLNDSNINRFEGWWGSEESTRFLMGPEYTSPNTAEGWQLSNVPVLLLASLRASIELFEKAGMQKLRKKSKLMSSYLFYLLNELKNSDIKIISPEDENQRGAQISIKIQNSNKKLFNRLIEMGVICDWREPDVIRVSPVPLYNTFEDVYLFSEKLKNAL